MGPEMASRVNPHGTRIPGLRAHSVNELEGEGLAVASGLRDPSRAKIFAVENHSCAKGLIISTCSRTCKVKPLKNKVFCKEMRERVILREGIK